MSNWDFSESQMDEYANEGPPLDVHLGPSMPINDEERFEEGKESSNQNLGKRYAEDEQDNPKRQRHNSLPEHSQDPTVSSRQKAIQDFKVTKPLTNVADFDWEKYKYTLQDTQPFPPSPAQLHTSPLPKPGTHHYVSHFNDPKAPSPMSSLTLCPSSGDGACEGYYPQQEIADPVSLDTYGFIVQEKLLEEYAGKEGDSCQTNNDRDALLVTEKTLGDDLEPEGNDEYSIASSDEEEMARLADIPLVAETLKIPSSSVIRGMDDNSSIEAFDPSLQRSPPSDATQAGRNPRGNDHQHYEEDLLDYNVDWDEVMGSLPSCPRDPSLPSTKNAAARTQQTLTTPFTPRMKPFARPRFPAPVNDKSPVTGISKSTVLRTCFRIGELLNEAKKCDNAQQEAIFEVYARVTYSSREGNTRVQHFQFTDLFKDQLPYPTGMLNGWKTGSLLDQQSAAFLDASRDRGKMCRCICRINSERKRSESDLGWVVVVLGIREVDWDEVELMRQIICRI